mmetsp:Transcript_14549/g.45829  ORF Transcript_14549/g.45829 Transcript_14549/m.45829 type:complete len:257 (+) Transcript_14549:80-850(+)
MGYRLGASFGSVGLGLSCTARGAWGEARLPQEQSALQSSYKPISGTSSGRAATPSGSLRLAAVNALAPAHPSASSARTGHTAERPGTGLGKLSNSQVQNKSFATAAVNFGGAGQNIPEARRRSSKKELRRRILGLLADPDLEVISEKAFRAQDRGGVGQLSFADCCEALSFIYAELHIPEPGDNREEGLGVEQEPSRRRSLGLAEFHQLLRRELQHSACDETLSFGEFFDLCSVADVGRQKLSARASSSPDDSGRH